MWRPCQQYAVSLTDTAKITATEDVTLLTATMASSSAFATETSDREVVAVEINDSNDSSTILSPFTSSSNAMANTSDALNNLVALATDSISELSASGAASVVVITSYSTVLHTALQGHLHCQGQYPLKTNPALVLLILLANSSVAMSFRTVLMTVKTGNRWHKPVRTIIVSARAMLSPLQVNAQVALALSRPIVPPK